MTVELATRGWEVSGRTASRILRRAHKETLGDRSPVTLSSESDEVALPHERGVQPGLV
jgi:hypothetical protein